MSKNSTTYLSLGSNLNDKLQYLKDAVQSIDETIGKVCAISSVYQTPSWGFDGNDFYNICIEVSTKFSAEELLDKLLVLETKLGRKRNNTTGYENRTIDIDIILYENRIIDSEKLKLPHPKALERKFVLLPLEEINSDIVFPKPILHISQGIQNCKDSSTIVKTNIEIKVKNN
ncbi:MAG: 2-amino-4-hydroxy-6-hydroxymethyldihydropteridine diphosphokinase [Flavicella sp.]